MLPKPTKEDWDRAIQAVRSYGEARKHFRREQESLPVLLMGNDNKVGVCGEFWAKKFYVDHGYEITEVPLSNNEGYDFTCAKAGQKVRVSVKVISQESKTGRQLRLKESEKWDELLMILLNEELVPYCFGLVSRSQFNQAVYDGAIGKAPFMNRSACNRGGWISRYGKVEKVKE